MRIFLVLLFICFVACNDENTNPEGEAKEFDLLIADLESENGGAIIKINPSTGTQTILSKNGRFQWGPQDIVIDDDGMIYISVSGVPGDPPEIVKVDPDNGTQTTISSGGYLKTSIQGIAFENSGKLLVTKGTVQLDRTPRLLRIDKITGEQEVLSQRDRFRNLYDVIVSENNEIYTLGTGIQTINNINYEVASLFKIDPVSGDQTELFQSIDYLLYQMAFHPDGSILAVGNAIIRIQPTTGQYEDIISSSEGVYFNAIAISESGDIFVTKHLCCPRSDFSICRVDVGNGDVKPLTFGSNYMEFPTGMAIQYSK